MTFINNSLVINKGEKEDITKFFLIVRKTTDGIRKSWSIVVVRRSPICLRILPNNIYWNKKTVQINKKQNSNPDNIYMTITRREFQFRNSVMNLKENIKILCRIKREGSNKLSRRMN